MGRKLFVIIPIALVLIAAAFLVLFVFMRQPDSNYDSLKSALSKAQTAKDAIATGLINTSPFYINEEYLTAYSRYSTDFSKEIDSVNKNPVVAGDSKVRSVYDSYKETLQSYMAANGSLISSIKLYLTIASSCRDMGYQLDSISSKNGSMTLAVFGKNSGECQAAISKGESSSDSQFNKQFFNAYLDYMTALVAAYKQEFSANGNTVILKSSRAAIEKTWDNIQGMNSATLDLKRSPDPTEALTKISEITTSQKAQLLR